MKKLMSILMVLVMLALPAMGMAASPFEMMTEAVESGLPLRVDVEFIPGEIPLEKDVAAIVADVLDALDFTYMQQSGENEQVDFMMNLSGNPVLTLSTAVKEGVSYIASDLLGAGVVAVTEEELLPLMQRMVNMMVASDLMTKSDAEILLAQLPEIIAQEQAAAAVEAEQLNEVIMGDVDFGFSFSMEDKITVEEVTMQPRNADFATQKVQFTMSGEEVQQVYEEIFTVLENNEEFMAGILAGVESAGETMTPDEVMKTLREVVAQAAGMLTEPAQVEAYLNDEGDLVALNMGMNLAVPEEDDGKTEKIQVELAYSRLTVNDALTHTATVIAKDDENDGVSLTGNLYQSFPRSFVSLDVAEMDDGVVEEAMLGFSAELMKNRNDDAAIDDAVITVYLVDEDSKQEYSFTVKARMEANANDGQPTMTMDAGLYLMDSENPMLTVKANARTDEAAPSIITGNEVHPGAMDDAAFNAYAEEVVNNLQTWLIVLVQNLPQSVLMLLLGGM